MFAVVREVAYKPDQTQERDAIDARRDECEALLETVPGYYGAITVEIGDGRFIRIALWESAEGRETIADREEVRRYHEEYMPLIESSAIGWGQVVSSTLKI